ncbi:unnamed protein product, partial [marine sediment metagenome]
IIAGKFLISPYKGFLAQIFGFLTVAKDPVTYVEY